MKSLDRIGLEEAGRLVEKHIEEALEGREIISLPLDEALGMTLAEDLIADMDQPPFRRSTMDGYAITDADYKKGEGIVLSVGETIDAGDTGEHFLVPGKALRIMTGGRVPEEASWVVPLEDCRPAVEGEEGKEGKEGKAVEIAVLPEFNNIAPVGEDFFRGDLLMEKGSTLNAYAIALLGTLGKKEVGVFRKGRVSILSTGSELVSPGEELKPGQIYDGNLTFLKGRLREMGFDISLGEMAEDSEDLIEAALKKGLRCGDMVITTGGVSVGDKDLMEKVIVNMGGDVVFHGISVKPGMPTMLSVIDGIPVLSLSGNPYSASAVLEYIFPRGNKRFFDGILDGDFPKKRPVPRIVRGYWDGNRISLNGNQLNGSVSPGAGANCLALLPEGEEKLPSGTRVRCLLI